MKRFLTFLSSLILVVSAVGCATKSPRPDTLLTQAQSRAEQARSLGAEKHAPVVLRDAQKNLERAQSLMQEEEYAAAERYLEKALADADLAVATSNAAKSEKAAEQVQENLRALEREMQ